MNVTPESEFARGWPLLLGAGLGIAAGLSSLYFYAVGIFIKPLAAEFGWSPGQASIGVLLGRLGAAAASPVIGRLVDRFGTRLSQVLVRWTFQRSG